MRILFETGSTCIGGAERVLLKLAHGIQSKHPGWQLDAIVLCRHGGLEAEYRATFGRVFEGPGDDLHRESARWIAAAVAEGGYDIVHCIDSFDQTAEAARLCPQSRFIQNVFPNCRTSPFAPSPAWLADRENPYAAIVTEFSGNLRYLPSVCRPPRKSMVIPNGIDTEFWTPFDDSEFNPPERDIDVCWCARTDAEKGIGMAMEIVPLLCGRGLKYCIVTSEPDGPQDQLLQLAYEHPVNFVCHCRLPPEQLRSIFRRSKIFLSTSSCEGMPGTPLEAAACGCRPFVPAIDGMADCFCGSSNEDGFCWPVPPEAASATLVAHWIERLLTYLSADETVGTGLAARKIAERYSLSRMIDAYTELYERVMQ